MYKQSNYNIEERSNNKIYIANTLNLSIIEIKPDEYDCIMSLLTGAEPKNEKEKTYTNQLLEQGFIVPKDYDEKKNLHFDYHKHYFNEDFLDITFIPTFKCNFECPYCFENEKELTITDSQIETLIKYFNNQPIKKLSLQFFGGEPLLEWKRIKYLINNINVPELKTQITTNAYLLGLYFNEVVELINSFQITIDGNEANHNKTRVLNNGVGTYDIVVKNTKKLLSCMKTEKKETCLVLRINLLNVSTEDFNTLLSEFIEYAYLENFYLSLRPVYNTHKFNKKNDSAKMLEDYYKIAKDQGFKVAAIQKAVTYCEGDSGTNTYFLNPDLSIWKCVNNMDYKDSKIGQINEKGKAIINKELLKKWSYKNPFEDSNCRHCKYLPLCLGSCALQYAINQKRNCFHEKGMSIVNALL